MNKTHSLALLAAVSLSVGFPSTDAYAQSGKIYINPSPLDMETVREPAQDDLMTPVGVTEQKVSDERALLNSIIVPEPDSDYFNAPEQVVDPVEEPDEASLTPVMERADGVEINEYEQWVSKQRTKYQKANEAVDADISVGIADDDLTPITAVKERREPVALSAQEQEKMLQRPTEYKPEQRMSASPELVAKVNEISQDDYGQAQPLAAQMDWNALEGSSIRQVLQTWSTSADVRLMWLDENDFAVLNPFIMRSTYERAVQKMLDQYQDNHVRPVATLHIDPDTGVKTLVVRVVEGQ